jgi:hypothetical protein
VLGRVPDRFGLDVGVVLDAALVLRGDGVDDLPVAEGVTVPAEVGLQVGRGLGEAGSDDEPQAGVVQIVQVARGQHPGVSDHDHGVQAVALLERLDDRDQGGGLGLVALEAADLEREPVPVDEQPDDDLRVDPAFLGITPTSA